MKKLFFRAGDGVLPSRIWRVWCRERNQAEVQGSSGSGYDSDLAEAGDRTDEPEWWVERDGRRLDADLERIDRDRSSRDRTVLDSPDLASNELERGYTSMIST
jgi:hypothetical protein